MSAVGIREVNDERTPMAAGALALIEQTFDRNDRQAVDELRSEIEEKRLGLLSGYSFHLLAAVAGDVVVGTAAGVYLGGVNSAFVTYLSVVPEYRGQEIARELRDELIELCRAAARLAGQKDIRWVMGEVVADSPWLQRLVRDGGAIPFDLTYYHPGMQPGAIDKPYILYREPFGDHRIDLPARFVSRLLYSIYRRAYRVKYPLGRPGFRVMLDELNRKQLIGVHPDFADADLH